MKHRSPFRTTGANRGRRVARSGRAACAAELLEGRVLFAAAAHGSAHHHVARRGAAAAPPALVLQAGGGSGSNADAPQAGATLHYYDDPWWGSPTHTSAGFTSVGASAEATTFLTDAAGPIHFHSDDPMQPPPGAPAGDDGQDYSLALTGRLRSGAAGQYLFVTQSDDDSYFVVNGKLVAQNVGGASDDTTGMTAFPITLAADTEYDYQYYVSQQGGSHGFHARWLQPGQTDTSNGGVNPSGYAQAPLIPISNGGAGFTTTVENLPAAPSLPAGGTLAVFSNVAADSVKIHFFDNAVGETQYVVERSNDASFTTVDGVTNAPMLLNTSPSGGPGGADSFTVTGLSAGTTYYFRLRASNYDGQSAALNLGSVTTLTLSTLAKPLARVLDNGNVVLTWTDVLPTGSKVSVQRSNYSGPYQEIAQVDPVAGGGQNTYTDARNKGVQIPYRYRLQVIGGPGGTTSPTVDVPFTVILPVGLGPITYRNGFPTSVPVDGTGRYAGPGMGLQLNGNANSVAAGVPTMVDPDSDGMGAIRMTTNGAAGGEASTVWTADKVYVVGTWMTQFDFRLKAGAAGSGFALVLQNQSNTFVGGAGEQLGYGGVGTNALALAFDTTGGHSTTGAYLGGSNPGENQEVADPYLPDAGFNHGIDLNPGNTGIDLKSGHTLRAVLSYDGSDLSEMVLDLEDANRVVFNYDYGRVDLAQVLGGDKAWIGFSAATGNAVEQLDIQNWYDSAGVIVDYFGPMVQSVALDDGSAQRSQIRSVTVAFRDDTTIASGAMKLLRFETDASGNSTGISTDISSVLNEPVTSSNGTVWTWTFKTGGAAAGSFTEANGSLKDGVYQYVLDQTKVVDRIDTPMSQDYTSARFHRLFGDINGNKTVNTADYGQFRLSFGKASSDPGYNRAFDFDNNGAVNTADYGQFRRRFGKFFSYT